MKELLERLAKALPEEWHVRLLHDADLPEDDDLYLLFIHPDYGELELYGRQGITDGDACFALLDWIKSKGYSINTHEPGDDPSCFDIQVYPPPYVQGYAERGSTRTEAIVRAAIWVGGQK
jgi:hypothetical protein